uniref:Cytochrome P450 n=1 Tax=Fagus sylvatica TaxID=28930 RepID=A0A2N9IDY1_FAGSY
MFGSPSIIVCTPKLCRRVLTNDENFVIGYPKSTYLLTGRRSLHRISNLEHKRLRRLIASPINGHEALALHFQHTEGIVINSLDEWASMKQPFEFFTEMKRATFNILMHIFMGYVNDSTLSTMQNLCSDCRKGLMSIAINIPGFAFHKALKKVMIDMLMEAEDEDGKKLEDEDIVDVLLLSLSVGSDSSAITTLWAIVHLTEHPKVLQKAKEEQDEIIKRRPSTQQGLNLTDVKQMEYLAKVIDEMLRMANAFSLFREAKVDVNINGYIIPKGWKVLVWYGAVHMDPEIYENPQDFNPSRWNNLKAKAEAFIPFGAGSRFCPGSDLAKLIITIFIHHFILNYKLKRLNPDSPVTYIQAQMPTDKCLAQVIRIP